MNKEELLYRYFSESLSKAEEEEFYNLLKTDIEFKEQFEFERNIKRATKEKRNQDLRTKLDAFEVAYKQSKKGSLFKSPLWKIAASVIFIISAGWFGYQYFFRIDYEELYSANFEIYPNTEYDVERSNAENSLEREAFAAYGKEEYQKAITKFNSTDPKDYFAFYKAQSYMALNKHNEAKGLYKKIIKDDQKFVAQAHWYLALLYVNEKNNIEANRQLKTIIDKYDYNKEKAKTLYEILK